MHRHRVKIDTQAIHFHTHTHSRSHIMPSNMILPNSAGSDTDATTRRSLLSSPADA
ncbi:hypothetical protein BCR44DRAFT_1453060, partial [Catenaria anguillulae PL171]